MSNPTPRPALIGLTGPAGCGKDTIADLLTDTRSFVKLAFADHLRDEVCNAFSLPRIFLTRRETKEHPISALSLSRCQSIGFLQALGADWDLNAPRSPRQIMQLWGTEYRRVQDVTYWTQKAERQIRHLLCHGNSVAVTDVRFPDEAELIRCLGGVIWQVTRPGLQPTEGTHASAVTGDEFNPAAVIRNDGTLADLVGVVERAFDVGVVA